MCFQILGNLPYLQLKLRIAVGLITLFHYPVLRCSKLSSRPVRMSLLCHLAKRLLVV